MARNLEQLRRVEDTWPGRVSTVPLSPESIRRTIAGADSIHSKAASWSTAAPQRRGCSAAKTCV